MDDIKARIINFVRNYFDTHDVAPPLRRICKETRINYHELYRVFPDGLKQICEEADVPVPENRIKQTVGATEGRVQKEKGEITEREVMAAIRGRVRGEGYLDELKNMFRAQISRSREFAEACTDAGITVVLAALSSSNVADEELKRLSKKEGSLTAVVNKAVATTLKALKYHDAKEIEKLERERDEARLECVISSSQYEDLVKKMKPELALERIIHTFIMSGNVNPNVLSVLIDKWMTVKRAEILDVPWSVVQANFKRELQEQLDRSKEEA